MDTYITQIGVTTGDVILEFSYLVAAIMFVIGLKFMSHPETARKGNIWAAVGMGLAMVTTLFLHRENGHTISLTNGIVVVAAIVFGSILGIIIARRVKMTAMPQLVSLFNATGGAASALVALMEYSNPENSSALVTLLGLIIGTIAFSGSMVAYGKLDGKVGDIFAKWTTYFNLFLLFVIAALTIYLLAFDHDLATQTTLSYVLLVLNFR